VPSSPHCSHVVVLDSAGRSLHASASCNAWISGGSVIVWVVSLRRHWDTAPHRGVLSCEQTGRRVVFTVFTLRWRNRCLVAEHTSGVTRQWSVKRVQTLQTKTETKTNILASSPDKTEILISRSKSWPKYSAARFTKISYDKRTRRQHHCMPVAVAQWNLLARRPPPASHARRVTLCHHTRDRRHLWPPRYFHAPLCISLENKLPSTDDRPTALPFLLTFTQNLSQSYLNRCVAGVCCK